MENEILLKDKFKKNIPILFNEAISLGLINESVISDSDELNINKLKDLLKNDFDSEYKFNVNILKQTNNNLLILEEESNKLYIQLLEKSKFIKELQKTIDIIQNTYTKEFDDNIKLTNWLADKILNNNELFSNYIGSNYSINDIIQSIQKYKTEKNIAQNELESIKEELRKNEDELESIEKIYKEKKEKLITMEKSMADARKEKNLLRRKYLFLGKVQSELDRLDNDKLNKLYIEKKGIELKIQQLGNSYDDIVKSKFPNVNQKISDYTLQILKTLDCEYKNNPINIEKNELTISINNGGNKNDKDYLYEVGSASNWLSYHLAFLLALHKYFDELPISKVMPFIIFDQPSQVYFPNGTSNKGKSQNREDDEKKVKMIFETINSYAKTNKIQIIILEHANEGFWKDLDSFHTVEEWGNELKLIPITWMEVEEE